MRESVMPIFWRVESPLLKAGEGSAAVDSPGSTTAFVFFHPFFHRIETERRGTFPSFGRAAASGRIRDKNFFAPFMTNGFSSGWRMKSLRGCRPRRTRWKFFRLFGGLQGRIFQKPFCRFAPFRVSRATL